MMIFYIGEVFFGYKCEIVWWCWCDVVFFGLYGVIEMGFFGYYMLCCVEGYYYVFDDWFFFEEEDG